MLKPFLVIDAGHGGTDPGGGSCQYFQEKNMALQMSTYQMGRCEELKIPAIMTRYDDSTVSLRERAKIVKESGASYCISNHINAVKDKEVKGAETIHSIYADGKLANAILDQVVNAGMSRRRVFCKCSRFSKKKDYYYMHRNTGAVETVIVEYGFATNLGDSKLIHALWRSLAESALRGFCLHCGLAYEMHENGNHDEKDLVKEGIEYLYQKGYLTSTIWKMDNEKPLPAWVLGIVLKRRDERMKKK